MSIVAAQSVTTQTITASSPATAIEFPESNNSNAEVELYVTTDAEDVELVPEAADTAMLTIPAGEVNYPAGRWRLHSEGKPAFAYSAVDDDIEIEIFLFE